jgi:general secretion pathway protein I
VTRLKKLLAMYVPSPRTQLIDTPVVRGEGQGEGASPGKSRAPHPDPLPTQPKEQIDDVWGEGTRSCDHRCKRERCSAEMALAASKRRRLGLSLLEVMLAIAILGGALSVIGELIRIGGRNAEVARDTSTAQRLCETKMAEIAAGLILPEAVTSTPVEDYCEQDEWLYSIQIEQVNSEGMIAVWVTVEQNSAVVSRPVSFTLVRWMMDPEVALANQSATSSQTTSPSTGSQGSTTTGQGS